jgi:hypothetical protein
VLSEGVVLAGTNISDYVIYVTSNWFVKTFLIDFLSLSTSVDVHLTIKLAHELCFVFTLCSEKDKAHIRLAAATAILRLATMWDFDITPEIFRLTILIVKVCILLCQHMNTCVTGTWYN